MLLRKKMETNVFPPRVVTSRPMAMRLSIHRPGLGLTRAGATSFDGRMNFTRQEQCAPLPRQSLALDVTSLHENCDKIFQRQYLSYIFLRKIFGEGWLWL